MILSCNLLTVLLLMHKGVQEHFNAHPIGYGHRYRDSQCR